MALRLRFLNAMGQILNLAGMPGWVREARYTSDAATVTVRVSGLYTIVTVNDVDVYFYRMTGGIDGVGVSRTTNCRVSDTAAGDRAAGRLDSVTTPR